MSLFAPVDNTAYCAVFGSRCAELQISLGSLAPSESEIQPSVPGQAPGSSLAKLAGELIWLQSSRWKPQLALTDRGLSALRDRAKARGMELEQERRSLAGGGEGGSAREDIGAEFGSKQVLALDREQLPGVDDEDELVEYAGKSRD